MSIRKLPFPSFVERTVESNSGFSSGNSVSDNVGASYGPGKWIKRVFLRLKMIAKSSGAAQTLNMDAPPTDAEGGATDGVGYGAACKLFRGLISNLDWRPLSAGVPGLNAVGIDNIVSAALNAGFYPFNGGLQSLVVSTDPAAAIYADLELPLTLASVDEDAFGGDRIDGRLLEDARLSYVCATLPATIALSATINAVVSAVTATIVTEYNHVPADAPCVMAPRLLLGADTGQTADAPVTNARRYLGLAQVGVAPGPVNMSAYGVVPGVENVSTAAIQARRGKDLCLENSTAFSLYLAAAVQNRITPFIWPTPRFDHSCIPGGTFRPTFKAANSSAQTLVWAAVADDALDSKIGGNVKDMRTLANPKMAGKSVESAGQNRVAITYNRG